MADEQAGYSGVVYSDYDAGYTSAEGYTGVVRGTSESGYTGAAPVMSGGQSEGDPTPANPWPLEAPVDTGESGSGSIEVGGLPIIDDPPSYEGALLDERDDVIGPDESKADPIIDDPPSYEGVVLDESRVEPGVGQPPRYDTVIAPEEPSGGSASTPMRPGFGDVKIAETEAETAAREQLRQWANQLLMAQLKADQLQPLMSGDPNLAEQHRALTEHLLRMKELLEKAGEGGIVDRRFYLPIKVGTDAGGLAADLIFLDRLAAMHGLSRISRSGANLGLGQMWNVFGLLKEDPLLAAETNAREAVQSVYRAAPLYGHIRRQLLGAGVMRAGVQAAQIMDFIVSAPALLATGNKALTDLARWLTEGGGSGFGVLTAAGPGGALTLLVSGGRTLVLTAAQVEALVQAGLLSANALALYNLSTGGTGAGALPPGGGGTGEGPFGARPPGSKSRFKQEDILEDIGEATERASTGQRALEEAGVTARQLRKIEENHHLLVQQLRRWFKKYKINIDDYTVRLSADEHRWIHNEYKWNDLWKDFRRKNLNNPEFSRNPEVARREIFAFMRDLQKRFGLEGLEIVPYPR